MPPPASFLAALHRLAAPAPQRVLRPVTNLRTLRWAHCPQVAPSAAAATQRVFQDDTPAESPVAAAQEPPPPPSRALLLAKASKKRRLDEVCAERYPEHSRNVVQSWIAQGKVSVNSRVVIKAGAPVAPDAAIVITADVPKFVCRAGLKLEAALDAWGLDVAGLRCLDAGVSTGGFADCLLQRGAAAVVGVDVGYGQVAERVRTDARVALLERTNLRYLELGQLPGGERVDLATLDLSFISVLKVLPAVCGLLAPGGALLVLIKPQFEAGRAQVGGGGIVRSPRVHRQVVADVTAGIVAAGFSALGCIESPLKGATSGNTEFLAYFRRRAAGGADAPDSDVDAIKGL